MSKELNLMLHCGANHVERQDVIDAPTPEGRTRTHYPIPHATLLDEVERNLEYGGLAVVNEAHGLSHEGNRYFGLIQLRASGIDHAVVVGVRNSHDQTFPAAFAIGAGVFVCDNLSFSGQVTIARRHTRFILRDLPGVVHRAVTRLGKFASDQRRQFAEYQAHELSDDRARSLVVESVKRRILPTTQLPKVVNAWENPTHDEFSEPTMWRLFNAFTEIGKEWSAEHVLKRTQQLHALLNQECGLHIGA